MKKMNKLAMAALVVALVAGVNVAQSRVAGPAPVPAGSTWETGFSPDGSGLRLVLKAIGEARKSIEVAAYSFTSKPIAEALVVAQKRGVQVRVVADHKANSGKYSAVTYLANQHVPVRLDSNYPIMHNKYALIDNQTLETGSFNYTSRAASRNAENVLVLRNVPEIVTRYEQDWQRLWDESQELKPKY